MTNMLSLFLMLLSFFIIMNSTSNFDDSKARPVMRSLALAFSGGTVEQGAAPLGEFVPQVYTGEGETLERIEALFFSHIPDVQSRRNRLGTMMRVRLPVRSFETGIDMSGVTEPQGAAVSYVGGKGGLLPMLVALLQSQDAGVPYRMDMMLAVSDDPAALAANDPEMLKEKANSVSMLANTLEKAGIPGALLGTGLERGENGFIDIYFRRDEPYEPAPAPEAPR